MKGNIGRQQVEANTTLPSAARLATIVRPDPDLFGLVSSVLMRLFSSQLSCRSLLLVERNHRTTGVLTVFAQFPFAFSQVVRQNPAELFQRLQSIIKFMEFLTEKIVNLSAFFSATCSQQALDLVEREPQLLSLLNEEHSIDCGLIEETKPA